MDISFCFVCILYADNWMNVYFHFIFMYDDIYIYVLDVHFNVTEIVNEFVSTIYSLGLLFIYNFWPLDHTYFKGDIYFKYCLYHLCKVTLVFVVFNMKSVDHPPSNPKKITIESSKKVFTAEIPRLGNIGNNPSQALIMPQNK
jgi:hypothetical protein